ncbi:MAG: hypothetical protein COU08_03640 [Candidatus Harrisonbacteria bacterium CG10_big_fil_rev_8_21_14_0_10_42_17]|uniref:Uncharacterized protein n=1 Tax=Candidatus Harrisonbacteria bacterium CG10_big_fil_rev_8_21_14_0_10_42_17 TaxID=1974584 RepID=A0A2M6WHD1_9BACT|nr:MAG: hypothetical protein COU08_03640 [Candidatus Harrisonbacteria bacterium CG10_big_fil_rev_8_21_14_0_10_42_17]
MTRYGIENWGRFQRSGVKSEDIEAMKMETVENAFEDTKEDFAHLIEQISEGIKEGRWTTILGDDVSGRLPALVIGKIIARYNREHGMNPPKRIFFAGGSINYEDVPDEGLPTPEQSKQNIQEQQQKLATFIHEQSKSLGDRVLIVTEHVVGGRTVRRIGKTLYREGVNFDVASLWSTKQTYTLRTTLKHEDPDIFDQTQFFIGKENAGASDPFGSEVSNVLYNLGVPLNETTGIKKDGIEPIAKLNKEANRDLVKLARQKVSEMTDEIYLKNFNEK